MIVSAMGAFAQRTVSGKVADAEGRPIAGATVQVKNSRVGTTTGEDGTFSIAMPANSNVLVISAIGLATQELTVGTRTNFDVTLRAGAESNLQEVVVVGYGTQRRKEVTGSLSTIKGQAISERPVQSFDQALAGRAAGVQITIPSGVLNAPPVFRIRGTNSISLSSQPLIVIDGVPAFTGDVSSTFAAGNALANINPNDIESIDIAKDAASAAIYGSRAANGVVFVTTKKGKGGKPRVSYDSQVGWTEPLRLPVLLDAYQYTDYKNLAVANANSIRSGSVNFTLNGVSTLPQFKLSTDAAGNVINTRWYDYVYRTGFSQTHNANVSGGSENTTYYLGLGYSDQEGIIKRNDYKRLSALLSIDSRLGKLFSVGGKLSFANEKNLAAENSGSIAGNAYSTAGLGRNVLVNAPNVSPYNNDGSYHLNSNNNVGAGANIVASNQVGFYNPVVALDLNRSNSENDHIQSNVYLQLKPINWITLRSTYGIDYINTDNDIFYNPIHGTGQAVSGEAQGIYEQNRRWVWTNTAQFDYTFKTNHTVSLLAGNEQQRSTGKGYGIQRQTLSDPQYNVVQAGFTTNQSTGQSIYENYLLSMFGRLNYDFAKKYYLSGNIRQDEYSALGVKKGIFWGASAGWEITKERFWERAHLHNVFSSFKIRGSYGKVGNISGIGNYPTFSTFGSGLYGGQATLVYNAAGNNQITWETSYKTDVGFSFGLFKDRINGEFAWYNNDINGLILSVPQAPSTGLPTNVLQNVGSMYNRGVEFTLNANPVSGKNFTWNTSFNIAYNKNEVTELAPGVNEVLFLTGSATGAGTTGETVNRTAPGYSLGYLWVVRSGGIDPNTGRRIFYNKAGRAVTYQHITPFVSGNSGPTQPQWTYLDDGTQAPAITQAADAVMYQNTIPKYVGGWSNNARYKGFELDVLFTYQLGFYVSYGTNAGLHDNRFWNNEADILDHWKKPGDITKYPRPIYGDNVSAGNTIPSDFNVFKGDFIKLKNVTFGYTLPTSVLQRVGISKARVFVSGQNLAIITKYPGPDPEVSSNGTAGRAQGSDRNTVPNARTITAGINLGF